MGSPNPIKLLPVLILAEEETPSHPEKGSKDPKVEERVQEIFDDYIKMKELKNQLGIQFPFIDPKLSSKIERTGEKAVKKASKMWEECKDSFILKRPSKEEFIAKYVTSKIKEVIREHVEAEIKNKGGKGNFPLISDSELASFEAELKLLQKIKIDKPNGPPEGMVRVHYDNGKFEDVPKQDFVKDPKFIDFGRPAERYNLITYGSVERPRNPSQCQGVREFHVFE